MIFTSHNGAFMMRKKEREIIGYPLILLIIAVLFGWCQTVFAEAYAGYTLFSSNNSRNTYLVNMSNTVVHSWTHSRSGGYSAYLLENSHVLRTANINNPNISGGGAAGAVQEVDWGGVLVWEYIYSSTTYLSHHDIEPMPNGNVLLIAWEVKTAAQARQAGYNRNVSIWPDHIIEVEPVGSNGGNIVWQWHAWDHLIQDYDASKDNYGVVGDHPELLDINMSGGGGPGGGDWMHTNGISYNPQLNQIVITSHTLNEVYVIDHSTTTEEAAGHSGGNSGMGGDILYRWGQPSNYDAPGSAYFRVVHCPFWIPEGYPGAGHILAFNNRENQGTSIIAEIIPPSDSLGHYHIGQDSAFGPSAPTWTYTASGFYSNHLGGCQRLPNGNTFIVESTSGNMFEVDQAGAIQWSYNRGGEIARALRYGTDYSGLYPLDVAEDSEIMPSQTSLSQNYPNPFNGSTVIGFFLHKPAQAEVTIYNILGAKIRTLKSAYLNAGDHQVIWDSRNDDSSPVASGIYFCILKTDDFMQSKKIDLVK